MADEMMTPAEYARDLEYRKEVRAEEAVVPKYQYRIDLEFRGVGWYAVVTRMQDHERRNYYSKSLGELLDAQVAGWIAGYNG